MRFFALSPVSGLVDNAFVVDPDKKLARPLTTEPERVPFSVRDAQIMHGMDLVWRLLIGFIAALLGGLFLYLLLSEAPKIAARGTFGKDSRYLFGLMGLLGPLFLAFAAGQVLQLIWVGGDQGFDERLWARMTPRERGLWRLRESASGRWTFRLFVLLALAAFLYADAILWRVLWRDALSGDWLPAAAALLVTGGAAALAAWAFRGRSRPASARPDSVWVSEGRWVQELRGTTLAEAGMALALGVFALGVSALQRLTKDPDASSMMWSGVVALVFAVWLGIAAVRDRRHAPTRLEIVRETDRPLVLACAVTLPLAADEVARGDWLARLVASTARSPTINADYRWLRWLDLTAPVGVARGTSTLRFTFRLDMPKDMPYQPPTWMMRIEDRSGRRKAVTFVLPWQIVFPEEYPAA